MKHPYVSSSSLKIEVLSVIATTHLLKKCPKCGGKLTGACCHFGARQKTGAHQPLPEDTDNKTCAECDIIWVLSCVNTEDYPVTLPHMKNVSHTLHLRGDYNCFCRRRVFKRFWVHVETAPGNGKIKKRCESKSFK